MEQVRLTHDLYCIKDAMLTSQSCESVDLLLEQLKFIKKEIRNEYLQHHDLPWIIGFSGGKDSTLLLHLVIDCILSISPDDRNRRVYVVSNDTLVESPVFFDFLSKTLLHLTENLPSLNLPIEVIKTTPLIEDSFWVNLLGKGYPAPNRSFRWCTDRLKIRPTSRFIKEQLDKHDEAILLLGVRRAESVARARSIAKHEENARDRLTPHSEHKGCWIYSPIKDLTTEDVWLTLLSSRPYWGGSFKELISLYRSAQGGECPFVVSVDDAPSCGSSSARFGCWTCTVVEKDNSIDSLIQAGHNNLTPLASFRDRIKQISSDPNFRSKIRRNGQPGLGPLTFEARKLLLDELIKIQTSLELTLISSTELNLIREQWTTDEIDISWRELEKYIP